MNRSRTLAVLVLTLSVALAACSGSSGGESSEATERSAALDKVRLCITNDLRETIKPRTIIPSVVFQPDSLATGRTTCESNVSLSGPDVCFDVLRNDRLLARVGVSTLFGSMTAYNADRCEQTEAPSGRSHFFGGDLGRAELATATAGVKVCVNRTATYEVTAALTPEGQACR